MDRDETPRALWVGSALLVLVAFPLVFANVGHELTRGANEEIGSWLIVLALSVAGLVLRRSLRGWDSKAAAGGVGLVVLGAIGFFALVFATVPDHDAYRTLQWEHLREEPDNVTLLGPDDLPPEVWDAVRSSLPGDGGHVTLARADYDAFWADMRARGAAADDGRAHVHVDGKPIAFRHGPIM